MSEMNDIYQALTDARRAVESLMTWQRGMDGRDIVRSYELSINEGFRAYERLQRQMRDGRIRTSIEPPDGWKRTSCGCGDPGAMPPCSWCTDPANNQEPGDGS